MVDSQYLPRHIESLHVAHQGEEWNLFAKPRQATANYLNKKG